TFSENVQAGTGDGDVTLVDVTNGTDTRTITLPDGQLVFSTNTLTINPSSDLDNLVNYAVNVAATAVDDVSTATNSYAGLAGNTAMNFITIGVIPTFTATWLGDGAGNVDRVQLTFDIGMNITDADLAGGEGLPGLVFSDANSIDASVDYSTATYDNFTTEIFDLTTPYVGTASPAVTITYTAASFTTNDISATAANGGQETGDAVATSHIDGAPPVMVSATTDDINRDGQIDRMTFVFSENIDDGNSEAFDNTTIDITGYSGEAKVSGDDDNTEVIISFTQLVTADTDATPNANLQVGQVVDGTGNSVGSIQVLAATDGAGPAIISAVTGDAGGTAGEIDQITVTLSEDIDGATLDTDGGSDDFTVTGYTVTSVAANGSD
ncbi:MAG: hypothetical protein GY820_46740, partial [Gammaproteobacteria bacterium]|nr:hypothetical protein [Gammaproteobacteria bacterium]